MKEVQCIPGEIWLEIFLNLPFEDIYNVSLTSKYFYQIVQTKIIWKKLFHKQFNQFTTEKREILFKIRQEEKKYLRIYRNVTEKQENQMEIEGNEEQGVPKAAALYDHYNSKFIKLLQKRRKNSPQPILSVDVNSFNANLATWRKKMDKYYQQNSTDNFINWKTAFLICYSFRPPTSTNQILLKFKNRMSLISPTGEETELVDLGPSHKIMQPTWSPNSRYIAFSIDTTLKILDLHCKSIKTLSTRYPVFYIYWSPDSTRLAYLHFNPPNGVGCFLVDLLTELPLVPKKIDYGRVFYFSWSKCSTALVSQNPNSNELFGSLVVYSMLNFDLPENISYDRYFFDQNLRIRSETNEINMFPSFSAPIWCTKFDYFISAANDPERLTSRIIIINSNTNQIDYVIAESPICNYYFILDKNEQLFAFSSSNSNVVIVNLSPVFESLVRASNASSSPNDNYNNDDNNSFNTDVHMENNYDDNNNFSQIAKVDINLDTKVNKTNDNNNDHSEKTKKVSASIFSQRDRNFTSLILPVASESFFWSPDGEKLLIFSNDQIVYLWTIQTLIKSAIPLFSYYPTNQFARNYFPFSNQYHQSITLWNRDSDSFVISGVIDEFLSLSPSDPLLLHSKNLSGVFLVKVSDTFDIVKLTDEVSSVAFWSPS